MIPYPWFERMPRAFHRQIANALSYVSGPLIVLAFLLSPISLAPYFWARLAYRKYNDAWYWRGLTVTAAGIALAATILPIPAVIAADTDLLSQILRSPTGTAIAGIITHWLLTNIAIATALAGLAALATCHRSEILAERYIRATLPGRRAKLRAKRNIALITSANANTDDYVPIGIIVDDPAPWRTNRYGQIVERPFNKEFGHGAVSGGTGTGKTIASLGIANGFVECGGTLVFIDFKGSPKTRAALQSIARHHRTTYLEFGIGPRQADSAHYDPLAWEGTVTEKVSVLMDSFEFTTEGDSAHYSILAKEWLALQIAVLHHVGTKPGESSFEFLESTCSVQALKTRALPMMSAIDPHVRAAYADLIKRIPKRTDKELTGLQSQIASVVNAAGPQLRPPGPGDPYINLTKDIDAGTIIYFSLPETTDSTSLKVLGSLLFRNLTQLAGARMQKPGPHRPVLVMADEASALGERAVVVEDLYKQARESEFWTWMVTQDYSSWPESTQETIRTGSSTLVVLRAENTASAIALSEKFGTTPHMMEMRSQEINESIMGESRVTFDGASRAHIAMAPFITAERISSIPNQLAYVRFSAMSATRKPFHSARLTEDPNAYPNDIPVVRIIVAAHVLDTRTPPAPMQPAAPTIALTKDNPLVEVDQFITPAVRPSNPPLAPTTKPQPIPAPVAAGSGSSWATPAPEQAPQTPTPAPLNLDHLGLPPLD